MRRVLTIVVAGLLVFASPAFAQTVANQTDPNAQGDQGTTGDPNQPATQAYDQAPPGSTFPCVNSLGEAAICTLVAGAIVFVAIEASRNKSTTTVLPNPPASN